jgi:hypothetical protein
MYLSSFEPGIRRKASFKTCMTQKVNRIHVVLRGNLGKQQSLTITLFYNKTMSSNLDKIRKLFWRGINPLRRGKYGYLNNYIIELIFSNRRETRITGRRRDC